MCGVDEDLERERNEERSIIQEFSTMTGDLS
jgi:hypothetical protein